MSHGSLNTSIAVNMRSLRGFSGTIAKVRAARLAQRTRQDVATSQAGLESGIMSIATEIAG